jgi:hypothetical protein
MRRSWRSPAGAIILAKEPRSTVDGARSSFGGTFCNPYDTEREPGMSSAGSGTSVAANLTYAIGEETVCRSAARGSQQHCRPGAHEGAGEHRRDDRRRTQHACGPMCRTVADTARIFDAIAGYDPKDPYRAERRPHAADAVSRGHDYALAGRLPIGVVREYLNQLLTQADAERRPRRARNRGVEDAAPRSSSGPTGRCFSRASRARRRSSCRQCSRANIQCKAIRLRRWWRCTPIRRVCRTG